MNIETATSSTAADIAESLGNVQANIVRIAKRRDGNTVWRRRWTLHFFFRIVSEDEMEASLARLVDVLRTTPLAALAEGVPTSGSGAAAEVASTHVRAMLHPSMLKALFDVPLALLDAGLVQPRCAAVNVAAVGEAAESPQTDVADQTTEGHLHAANFRAWLAIMVEARKEPFMRLADQLVAMLSAIGEDAQEPAAVNPIKAALETGLADYPNLVADFRPDPNAEAPPEGWLMRAVCHELLRQGAPAFDKEIASRPAVRSEAAQDSMFEDSPAKIATPSNMAFSHAGLAALKLDPDTLRSFPDAFREGMAARAARLRDIGASAPENWDGELGMDVVHGYFTGGSDFADGAVKESFWRELRAEIRAFNDSTLR